MATNSFEGGTDATTVTTANSGGASGDPFDGVQVGTGATVAFSATQAAHGSLGLQIAVGGTVAAADVSWTTSIGSQATIYGRFYLYATANPAASVRIMTTATSGAAALCSGIYLMTDGTLLMTNTAVATILQTTNTVNLNGWTRVEFMVTGSTTTGHVELRMYKTMDSATATESLSSASNINTGGPIAIYSIGQGYDTKANVGPIWFDDVGFQTSGYFGPAGVAPQQPTLVADRGTVANATAATTSAVTLTSPTSIAVGNYLIARVAVDNSGTNGAAPGCTVTDPRSNTWTVLGPALVDPGAAAAGATAYLCYTRVATAYQAADALTFNWGGVSTTAKAIVVEEWTYLDPTAPVAVSAVTANAAASTAVTVSITPTGPGQLVYTCLATEGIAADAFTGDADTTNGTWTTLTTTASANATATNNQRVAGQYKVVTAAGAQTWNATITNRDWAALAVVFAPAPAATLPPPIQLINRAALVRAAYW